MIRVSWRWAASFAFLSVVAGAIAAQAAPSREMERLLSQVDRPTIAQLKAAFATWPKHNPFRGSPSPRSNGFEPKLAEAIAQLEFAYRGLVYAPLGRDGVMLGDMIDAFYQAQGQRGRVRRLNASTQSFTGANDEMIVSFLKSSGFDFEHLETARPFIIGDSSWYRDSSQSVKILRAAYGHYGRLHGGDRSALLHKLNMVNLYMDGGLRLVPGLDRKAFVDAVQASLPNHPYPEKIFSLSVGLDNERFIYTTEWHDKFTAFRHADDGSVFAPAGAPGDTASREQVLYDLYEIIERVKTPGFRAAVDQEARRFGFKFDPAFMPACGGIFE